MSFILHCIARALVGGTVFVFITGTASITRAPNFLLDFVSLLRAGRFVCMYQWRRGLDFECTLRRGNTRGFFSNWFPASCTFSSTFLRTAVQGRRSSATAEENDQNLLFPRRALTSLSLNRHFVRALSSVRAALLLADRARAPTPPTFVFPGSSLDLDLYIHISTYVLGGPELSLSPFIIWFTVQRDNPAIYALLQWGRDVIGRPPDARSDIVKLWGSRERKSRTENTRSN